MTPRELFEYFLDTDFKEHIHDYYKGFAYATENGLTEDRLISIISDLKKRYSQYTIDELRDKLDVFNSGYFPELLDIILVENSK